MRKNSWKKLKGQLSFFSSTFDNVEQLFNFITLVCLCDANIKQPVVYSVSVNSGSLSVPWSFLEEISSYVFSSITLLLSLDNIITLSAVFYNFLSNKFNLIESKCIRGCFNVVSFIQHGMKVKILYHGSYLIIYLYFLSLT